MGTFRENGELPVLLSKKTQVGGNHYKNMPHQPLEVVLDNLGYEAFKGACITKILKYLMRVKGDNYKEDVTKALHILKWLEEETK